MCLPLGLGLAAVASSGASPAEVAVTVYSRDLAFVRESRVLDTRSSGTVRIADVPERIDISSVRLTPSGKGRVVRLAYRFDVAGGDRLLEGARGRRVRVTLRGERALEGTLRAADGSWLVVEGGDSTLHTLARAAVEDVRIAGHPQDLAFAPTLEASLEGVAGAFGAELSYLTGGLSWSAEHTLVRAGETDARWSSHVTVENTCGRDFADARLSLVAGEPRREAPVPPPIALGRSVELGMAAAERADFAEQPFAEYHLYTLDRPATLRHRESQTLALLESRAIRVSPRYRLRPGVPGVGVQLEARNVEADGLGVPLPAGRVRFYEREASGPVHFTGETRIAHTAAGEKLVLDVGTAFDLVGERREVYNKRLSDREREYQIEVKLRNRKKAGVAIHVEERVAGDHEVLHASHPPRRKDSTTLEFEVPVAAGKESVLSYAVRIRY